MIVTHSFDLLIMDPNSFLQLVHEFCMLLSIIYGSVLVLKNDFQPNEQRNTFSITRFHFTTESLEFSARKKNNCVHLNVGPRSPSLDSISARRCSTWELDTVGSAAIVVWESWFWQAHVIWGCRKTHTKTSAILKSRVGMSMRDSCFLLHFCLVSSENTRETWKRIRQNLHNFFPRESESLRKTILHRLFRFLNARKNNVREGIECCNCCNPWRKTKRGEEAESMLCLSRNEKSARRLHCRTRWGKLWRSHRST